MKSPMQQYLYPTMGAIALALVLGQAGCSKDSDSADASTVQVDAVEPGADCANGGYRITLGADDDGNGTIEGEEVVNSYVVCDGAAGSEGAQGVNTDGVAALTAATDLALYDANCPYGGSRVDVGLDNGDGEGTAGDNVLQPGEIDDTTYVCNGKPVVTPEPWTPPDGPEGSYTINSSGGKGTSGIGGNGGAVNIELDHGSIGGHVKLFRTGQADASFTLPAVTAYLGEVPGEIASGTVTIKAQTSTLTDHAGLTEGALHTHVDSTALWIYDTDAETNDHVEVTGLHIAAGATVTFEANDGPDVTLEFENDVQNGGTIKTEKTGLSAGELDLSCDNFFGDPGSLIDLSGSDATTGNSGGAGGNLTITADDENLSVSQDWGSVVNQGNIDLSGGAGDSGGDSGDLSFDAHLFIYNTGAVDTSGGTGNVTFGGVAGRVYFDTEYGDIGNSGAITAVGGQGETYGGDAYGDEGVYFYIGERGDLYNSGPIDTSGGLGKDSYGGAGGEIRSYVYGGAITNAANLTAKGGEGKDGGGGAGGGIYIKNLYEPSGWEGDYTVPGDIVISGSLDTRGSAGTTLGGAGGPIGIYLDAYYAPFNQEIILYGYTDLITNGGEGIGGGDAGNIFLQNEYGEDESGYFPSGGVFNHVNVSAVGGEGKSGVGGNGGDFEALTDYYYAYLTEWELVHNYGNVNISGGPGTTGGGESGYVVLFGNTGVENHGAITLNGGAASGASTTGGNAVSDGCRLIAEQGNVLNDGAISASGGASSGTAGTGGSGAIIELFGTQVTTSGNLTSAGGNATGTGATTGGDAEGIFLFSASGSSTTSGTFSIAGGTGATAGAHGEVVVDGENVTASHL